MHHLADLAESPRIELQAIGEAALPMGSGIGSGEQQIQPAGNLGGIPQVGFQRGAGHDLPRPHHGAVGSEVREGQNLLFSTQHVGGRADAHDPAARAGEQILQFGNVTGGHQQDLPIGRLFWQDPSEGIQIGLLEQGGDHLPRLSRPLQLHLGTGQWLPTGDHDVTSTQRDQIGFQVLQFSGANLNPTGQLRQFRVGAPDFSIATPHLTVEAIALELQATAFGLQGGQFLAQASGALYGLGQLLLHPFLAHLGAGHLRSAGLQPGAAGRHLGLAGLQLGLAGAQLLATLLQSCFQPVKLEQACAQPLAHQQHQTQGNGADQAAREDGDHHCGVLRAQPEQAQTGLAHAAAEPIAQGGENPPKHQQRQDQQPARHGFARIDPVCSRRSGPPFA